MQGGGCAPYPVVIGALYNERIIAGREIRIGCRRDGHRIPGFVIPIELISIPVLIRPDIIQEGEPQREYVLVIMESDVLRNMDPSRRIEQFQGSEYDRSYIIIGLDPLREEADESVVAPEEHLPATVFK